MRRFYCIYQYQCDNQCLNCCLEPEFQKRKDLEFNYSQITNLLKNYIINKNDIIEISGGEPTKNKDFFLNFLKFLIEEKNFERNRINLLTHAQNFSSDNLTKETSKYLGHVTSTFYGANSSLHDYCTQVNGSFDKKIIGLKNLSDSGIDLHIKILTNKLNYNTLDDFIDLCSKYFSESHIIIGWLCLIGNAWTNRELLTMSLPDAKSNIESAIEKARDNSLNLNLSIPLCSIDPYYWEGHLPGNLKKGLEKVIFINPEYSIEEKKPEDVPLFSKPSKLCDSCILKEKCVWEWEGYDLYWDVEKMLKPIH